MMHELGVTLDPHPRRRSLKLLLMTKKKGVDAAPGQLIEPPQYVRRHLNGSREPRRDDLNSKGRTPPPACQTRETIHRLIPIPTTTPDSSVFVFFGFERHPKFFGAVARCVTRENVRRSGYRNEKAGFDEVQERIPRRAGAMAIFTASEDSEHFA